MILLGLAGLAGSGKNAVAAYLVERYGFVEFSFSDALYREVEEAFEIDNGSGRDLLRDRETKEVPTEELVLENCTDKAFVACMTDDIVGNDDRFRELDKPFSPRFILQVWGTAYRRAQHSEYWIDKAEEFIYQMTHFGLYPELRQWNFVNTSVRFPNEKEWIRSYAPFGSIWHLHRDAAPPVNPHESETALPVLDGERVIHNNYTLEYLHMGIDQLMSSNIPSIRIEPPEPMEGPKPIFLNEWGN